MIKFLKTDLNRPSGYFDILLNALSFTKVTPGGTKDFSFFQRSCKKGKEEKKILLQSLTNILAAVLIKNYHLPNKTLNPRALSPDFADRYPFALGFVFVSKLYV